MISSGRRFPLLVLDAMEAFYAAGDALGGRCLNCFDKLLTRDMDLSCGCSVTVCRECYVVSWHSCGRHKQVIDSL